MAFLLCPFILFHSRFLHCLQITQFNFYSDFKPFFANKGNSQAVYRRSSTAQPIPDVAHAVLLVGYHLDSQQPSNSYWIVKNSCEFSCTIN